MVKTQLFPPIEILVDESATETNDKVCRIFSDILFHPYYM